MNYEFVIIPFKDIKTNGKIFIDFPVYRLIDASLRNISSIKLKCTSDKVDTNALSCCRFFIHGP